MEDKCLQQFLIKNNGYITSKEFKEMGISRFMISKYVKDKVVRKIGHGLYIDNSLFEDELFILQKKNPLIVYSYNTAFYIMGLSDKIPELYDITIPINRKPRNREKFKIHQIGDEKYNLGIINVLSSSNNPLRVYNIERCICDYIRNSDMIDLETANKTIKMCFKEKKVDIDLLIEYSYVFNISKEINTLIGVMND